MGEGERGGEEIEEERGGRQEEEENKRQGTGGRGKVREGREEWDDRLYFGGALALCRSWCFVNCVLW